MRPRLKDSFWVVPQGNDLLLYDTEGRLLPKQIKIRVTADVDCFPTAICTCLVNIAKDEEEMRAEIERLRKPQVTTQ